MSERDIEPDTLNNIKLFYYGLRKKVYNEGLK